MGLNYPVYTPFRLQEPGTFLSDVEGPPPPPPPRPTRKPRIGLPSGALEVSPAGRAWALAAAQPPVEPEPPRDVTPPVGGEPTPPAVPQATTTAEAAPAAAESEDIGTMFGRARAEAEKIYGPAAEPPGPARFGPWEIAALAIPALAGVPQVSSAMLSGALAGRAQRAKTAREAELARQKGVTGTAIGLLPYYTAKAGERERIRISDERLKLDRQQQTFDQTLGAAKFAWQQFQHFNPSAAQQASLQIRRIEGAMRDAHYRAQEALANGRLDEYQRHNRVIESLTQQARDLTRQQVQIAAQRAQTGTPGDLINVWKFVNQQVEDIRFNMDYVTDETQRTQLAGDLQFYQQTAESLRPRVQAITGTTGTAPTTTTGGAPSARAQQVLTTYNTTRKAMPKAYWDQLTTDEQLWLMNQGIAVGE